MCIPSTEVSTRACESHATEREGINNTRLGSNAVHPWKCSVAKSRHYPHDASASLLYKNVLNVAEHARICSHTFGCGLQPENLLYASNDAGSPLYNVIKLVDFGLAKSQSNSSNLQVLKSQSVLDFYILCALHRKGMHETRHGESLLWLCSFSGLHEKEESK
jgi:hypothetical protein